MPRPSENKRQPIVLSCYFNRSREGEQFVPEHVFSYHISGTVHINDGDTETIFREGEFRFSRRNHLVKFEKIPPEGGEFKALSIYLDQETLRNFSREYGYSSTKKPKDEAVLKLKSHPLLTTYMESLLPYRQTGELENDNLVGLKLKEAILILLETNPGIEDVLFDFTEPGKIDLESFMNRNFHFNVELKRFAYLTGRSLATFKRDFEKIFQMTPNRWLIQRRLQEAYYLIKEKGNAPSEVYLELGFEDLSHFSFAFKKKYGLAPSKV